MQATVENGKVVFIHFTLTNQEGEELDSTHGDEPLFYLHGADNIVPGLEQALEGKQVGDKVQAVVAPEDGYGERSEAPPQRVSKDEFPDDMEVLPGMPLHAETDDGFITVWVTDVTADWVEIDTNHPLAGETLHFDVEIVRVRDAHKDELEHGHPHGPEGTEGHHHH
ncbi:peptidylprolyl isomerase [Microvenator marinus]|uniref:Peptidyl-prolyl cis-trans isomerase n=1 Tax=Microvenator marinus TaxID=2600177 RepID=A0A5B8XYV8_9DELT|nr:peptidylprolyl isomerase [Microvenator marinus]QED29163.1 peptidylprolyl isomerase [Microvenator marinus]